MRIASLVMRHPETAAPKDWYKQLMVMCDRHMEERGATTVRRSDVIAQAMRADCETQDLFVQLIIRKDGVKKEIAKVPEESRRLKEQRDVLSSLDPGSWTETDGKSHNSKKNGELRISRAGFCWSVRSFAVFERKLLKQV